MVKSKNPYELKLMRQSGKIAASALKKAIESIKVGVSEIEVDKRAEEEIYRLGGDLSYKTVLGYQFATCITVNEQVVHGLPTDRKFEEGDIVGVDLAVCFKGWHTDCAWSVLIEDGKLKMEDKQSLPSDEGKQSLPSDDGRKEKKRFLEVGEKALWEAIEQAVEGNSVGDISNAIQTRIEGAHLSIVRSLVGHGIGRSLHESPEISGYGKKGMGVKLKAGMTLAVEVIYTSGGSDVVLGEDGWTFSTADGSLGGLFEMTVVVGKKQAEVLTGFVI